MGNTTSLEVNLATKGNTIDKNIRQGARVLALKVHADTLDASMGEKMFIRGGKLTVLAQNSADILKGGKKLTPLMGWTCLTPGTTFSWTISASPGPM